MKSLFFIFFACGMLAINPSADAQTRNSPHDTVETADVKVTYGRPYKKGRVIFGELEPFGKVWRVGADEATEITFKKDMKFGGKDVKAGTYTLFAIPNENEWTIILNSTLKQWGAYSYEKNKANNVLQVNVPVKKSSTVTEQLTIVPENNNLFIRWDNAEVAIPLG